MFVRILSSFSKGYKGQAWDILEGKLVCLILYCKYMTSYIEHNTE